MPRLGTFLLLFAAPAAPAIARHLAGAECGTTAETAAESIFLHRQSQVARALRPRLLSAPTAATGNRDIGNIAIIEGANGALETLNQFNLDASTLTFTPSTNGTPGYRFAVAGRGYDAGAAAQGSPLIALGDDDARQLALPFPFAFYGTTYRQVFLNSDGNLTFTTAEFASTGRTLGRMTGGPPRISPLFDDMDPSQQGALVTYYADQSHAVFSWVNVPEYSLSGAGATQTFQVRLYVDGSIQFSYAGAAPIGAVVGIAPGSALGESPGAAQIPTTLADFLGAASGEYTGAIVERFGNTVDVDIVSVAQEFYQTHEDAYDYLAIYNDMGIDAAAGALAYESTVRSSGSGYGVPLQDYGQEYGSRSRLRSVLNLGRLNNYPLDANAQVPLRAPQADTPLTILGHEAGHLFLAFASISGPNNATAKPMLGFQGSHWSFLFDSEASLLEGEQISDRGASTVPRFLTTAITQGYAPLDRYLMGFSPASDVPDTFVVTDTNVAALQHQQLGVAFNGTRLNIGVNDVIGTVGRRTPDSTVAQRRFRFAFILLVQPGSSDAAIGASVQQLEIYRQQFPAAYAKYSGNLANVDSTLNHSLQLSLFPAAGVVAGSTASGAVTVGTAPAADLAIKLTAGSGYLQAPPQVTIAAGTKSAIFTITGLKGGVEELLATPADAGYETAFARVQVALPAQLALRVVSGDAQLSNRVGPLPAPVVVQLTDINGLRYPGARIDAAASAGGLVTPASATAGLAGQASFQWTPGAGAVNQLKFTLSGAPGVSLTVSAGSAVPVIGAVVNAASGNAGVAAGGLETIYGANLSGASVLINGEAASLLYASDAQINFYVPPSTELGAGTVTVVLPSGVQASAAVNVVAVQPGIFDGAVVHAGSTMSAASIPVSAGDFIEIYCTGLGATQTGANGLAVTTLTPAVYFGATKVTPAFSGLAPGFPGLYQVNVQVPPGLKAGTVSLVIASGGAYSNQVNITVQ
jgi:uncharacterized protein (TIGR03437 family)